jgi:hypothetical protein
MSLFFVFLPRDPMTLKQFFEIAEDPKRPNFRAWVTLRGFQGLYLRYGQRNIEGERLRPVLDIASVEVTHPGRGVFTRFLKRVKKMRPGLHLYVESVLSSRFCTGLEKRGFTRTSDSNHLAPNYYQLARSDGVQTGRTQRQKPVRKNRAQSAKKAA